MKDAFLDLAELQAALEAGWTVDRTQASSTGSILVILKKEA